MTETLIEEKPSTWVSSDFHFWHINILKYCDRPFNSVEEMNETIIARALEKVGPKDTFYILGDIAMGDKKVSLECVDRLPGYKIFVPGNHDVIFEGETEARRKRFADMYAEVVDVVVPWFPEVNITLGPTKQPFAISHFPYEGDSHDKGRYDEWRPKDSNLPLLHGHTHSKEKVSWSGKGTLQIHVGVDAWDFYPVSDRQIIDLYVKHTPPTEVAKAYEEPLNKKYSESRVDAEGIEWYACDPWPTWYRYEKGALILRADVDKPADWAEAAPTGAGV